MKLVNWSNIMNITMDHGGLKAAAGMTLREWIAVAYVPKDK